MNRVGVPIIWPEASPLSTSRRIRSSTALLVRSRSNAATSRPSWAAYPRRSPSSSAHCRRNSSWCMSQNRQRFAGHAVRVRLPGRLQCCCSGLGGRVRGLTDRRAECGVLDGLVEAVCAGESRVLVVHGEPGVGKTALLEYLADRATGCRLLRVSGVQWEMELAFAGLHQLCAPLLVHLEVLPRPQRDALRTAFGMSEGPAPDRFLVGLAVLGLLAEVAAERPVVCLVDDAQWLDRASAQALAFVARRLGAESVGMVFALREPSELRELTGLPELVLTGLNDADARALLESVVPGRLDERVRDRIVAETRGNPLALVELPRGLTAAELAGGFGLPGTLPLTEQIEESFARQFGVLPARTRLLVQLAAADPSGDRSLVWRAAGRLGIQ